MSYILFLSHTRYFSTALKYRSLSLPYSMKTAILICPGGPKLNPYYNKLLAFCTQQVYEQLRWILLSFIVVVSKDLKTLVNQENLQNKQNKIFPFFVKSQAIL